MTTVNVERRAISALALLLVSVCIAAPARAQDAATAEALFKEGRELLAAGKVDEACEKLAASQSMDPSSGTLLNLADCHLQQGKTATAWAEFLAAARLAKSQGRASRADEATRRAKEVESALSYVTISVKEKLPGLEVKRDDVALAAGALSSKIPVDPGTHVISASAPGYRVWSTTVVVNPNGDVKPVAVPALEKEAGGSPAPAPSAAPGKSAEPAASPGGSVAADKAPPKASTMQLVGFVLGGVGVVGLGVGSYFGLKSGSTYSDAEDKCPSHESCSPEAMDLREKAHDQATFATIGVGAGAALVATGAILLLTSGSTESRSGWLSVAPAVGTSSAGAELWGRF